MKSFVKIFFFREREGEKHRSICERYIYKSVACCTPPAGDLACKPDMCPDQELNWQPFGLQVYTQSTEPHQPELYMNF